MVFVAQSLLTVFLGSPMECGGLPPLSPLLAPLPNHDLTTRCAR